MVLPLFYAALVGFFILTSHNSTQALGAADPPPPHAGADGGAAIATGPRAGQKVFTLQTLPAELDPSSADVAEASGFS
jgi:hypothetical protein